MQLSAVMEAMGLVVISFQFSTFVSLMQLVYLSYLYLLGCD